MKISQYLVKIRDTDSIKEKNNILKKCYEEHGDLLLDIMNDTYNIYITYGINKLPNISIFGACGLEGIYPKFKTCLNQLANRQLTGNNAKLVLTKLLSLCDKDTYELLFMVIKRDLKLGMNVKSINKALGINVIKSFSVQLANKYKEVILKPRVILPDYFYETKKLNGFRCFYDNKYKAIFSKNGKTLVGFEHLLLECENICKKYNLIAIDGELYLHGTKFSEIQSICLASKNYRKIDKEKLNFNIFAVLSDNFKNTKDMIDVIDKIGEDDFDYIDIVKSSMIENKKDIIDKKMMEYVNDGYEGIMLRDPNVYYSFKRDNYLLKYKPFIEHDFILVDMLPGSDDGKYKNTLGSFLVTGEYDGKSILSEVGLKNIKEIERDDYFNNKEDYIGKVCEVKFQALSDEPNNLGNYSLIFGSFVDWKLDR